MTALSLDATNLRCPLPIIKLAKFAQNLPGGTVIEVAVSDPAAEYDIPAWARMKGHLITGSTPRTADSPNFTVTITLQ